MVFGMDGKIMVEKNNYEENGLFCIDNLVAGTYVLKIFAPNYTHEELIIKQ
tara:strand:+ start:419 stop:571 length:153 start_codon:yes stop_codon:yes gene_type:complete